MKPIPRSVDATRAAGHASGLARMEARRLGHHYLGAEHLLLGLLLEGDNLAARVLVAHGLDLETVRAEVERLIDQGVLPGPQPSDAELLATLGVDLEAVHARLQESFGDQAYWEAAQRVRRRPTQPVTHTPHIRTDPSPLLCGRALGFAAHEAIARDQEVGPEHLLLGLIQDAEDPVETDLPPQDRRQRAVLGLPDYGPNPIRLLVEARGLTLQTLREALRGELDSDQ
jgi:Clp amino terminal domain, pathogenicity island component